MRRLLCLVRPHMPRRSLARYDGDYFRAPCRRCAYPMIRLDSGWAPVDGEQGASTSGARPPLRTAAIVGLLLLLLAVAIGIKVAPRGLQMREHGISGRRASAGEVGLKISGSFRST